MGQPKKISKIQEILIKKIPEWAGSPLIFIKDMWNLTPQPIKPEYQTAIQILVEQGDYQNIRPEWFEPFIRGIHLTWQQWIIFLMLEDAIHGRKPKRISTRSGHGVGKSMSMSLILIWYLFTHKDAQIACTAPTSKQMFDVLWKEVSVWISRMPSGWHSQFDRQATYVRMTSSPETWFASAKTAKKDSTEALAGVHGEHVMILCDEASGVDTEIFNTMEGSLTEKDILVLLFSNPTRLNGYFYDTHHRMKHKWQTIKFSNIDSPIVRDDYNQDIIDQHGKNSDEYRIRVLGEFPNAEAVDDKGYTPILTKTDIREIERPTTLRFQEPTIMGIDPSGEGRDETVWVVRDQFHAAIVAREKISTDLQIAAKTRTLAMIYKVQPSNIYIDSFGVGSNVAAEVAKTWFKINAINVGDACLTEAARNLYLNRKAENYIRLQKAIKSGFELVRDKAWSEQLPNIKMRRNERNKIQIQSKKDYKKENGGSPDETEACMLTFSEDRTKGQIKTFTRSQRPQGQNATITRSTTNNLHSAI